MSCLSRKYIAIVALLIIGGYTALTPAQKQNDKRTDAAARHSSDAARVFTEVMRIRDKSIPKELLDKAEAVIVFPGVIHGAFIVGGRLGKGMISRRIKDGWGAPAFLTIKGGSFGLQAGGQKTDYVLLVMNNDVIDGLLRQKTELGSEVSVSAGPVGRTAAASTNPTFSGGILSYSRSRGIFAGVSIKGAFLDQDNDLNEAIYGQKAKEILTGPAMKLEDMPAVVRIFPRTLARYSVR
jgi:lipid-binding SYLF domain-containing protein